MTVPVKRAVMILIITIACYGALIGPFATYMRSKPIEEKLGYIPSVKVIRFVGADHKELFSAALVMKVLMYFGGIVGKEQTNVIASPPDYQAMSRVLHSALILDPYNMDGYYFAQSFLTWEVKQFDIANKLLDYGMKYRTWDWYLPFFAGFNHAYFLKDYKKAAEYYKRAGELSGQELHISLSSRYLQESGQTPLAISYLKAMISSSRNFAARKSFETRLKALEGVRDIELARDRYREEVGKLPTTIEELASSGYLQTFPKDPYGGIFYLEPDGKVATTSKFAFPIGKQGAK